MKRFLFIAILFLFFAPFLVMAQEKIISFNAIYQINSDTSIRAEECIVYDFGYTEHHGIFRDIPVRYKLLMAAVQLK